MKNTFFKFCVLLAFFVLGANDGLAAENKDSLRVEQLGNNSLAMVYSKPPLAKEYIDSALDICKRIGNNALWSLTYNYYGIYYDVTGNYDSAMFCYRKAIAFGKLSKQPNKEASAINNIGLLFWNNHLYDSALTYYYKSLSIYEKSENLAGQSNVLSNVGLIYINQSQTDLAVKTLKRALHLKYLLKDSLGIGKTLANIGGALEKDKHYDSSLFYKHKAEPFLVSSKNKYELATLYHDFGVTLNLLHRYNKAIVYANKSLAMRRELGSKKYMASTLSLLGGLYKETKEYEKAHAHLDEAIEIYEKYNIHRLLKGCYHRKAVIYNMQGEFKKANVYFEKSIKSMEQVYDEDKLEKLYEIEAKYENEKAKRKVLEQKKELLEKEKERTQMIIVMSLLGLVTLAVLLFFRNKIRKNKQKKKQELLEQKLEISRELHDNIGSQLTYINNGLESAFKTNNFSVVEEMSMFSKKTIKDLRTAIWGLNMKPSTEALVSKIKDEIATLKTAYPNLTFSHSLDVPSKPIKSDVAVNLLRVTQEAIQNACKYSNAKTINVSLSDSSNLLSLEISDDGIGFKPNEVTKGFGLENMQQRANKIGAALSISSKPKAGTRILMTINTTDAV